MRYDGFPERSARRWVGLGGVVFLHGVLGWGLLVGLNRAPVPPQQKVVFSVITETEPVPVDTAAPAPAAPAQTPRPEARPSRPVSETRPPPEAPPTPVRQAVPAPQRPVLKETVPAPSPVPTAAVAAPSLTPPAPAPASPAPAPVSTGEPTTGARSTQASTAGEGAARSAAAPTRVEVGLLCPGYKDLLETELSGLVERYGVEGEVRVQIVVKGHEIQDVRTVSGPREYHPAVRAVVRRFRCSVSGSDESRIASLTISFRQD